MIPLEPALSPLAWKGPARSCLSSSKRVTQSPIFLVQMGIPNTGWLASEPKGFASAEQAVLLQISRCYVCAAGWRTSWKLRMIHHPGPCRPLLVLRPNRDAETVKQGNQEHLMSEVRVNAAGIRWRYSWVSPWESLWFDQLKDVIFCLCWSRWTHRWDQMHPGAEELLTEARKAGPLSYLHPTSGGQFLRCWLRCWGCKETGFFRNLTEI